MQNPEDDFFALPLVPGYEINIRGQVRGASGRVLRHGADGRVQLNSVRGPRRYFIGDLLLSAGLLRPAGLPEAARPPVVSDSERAELCGKIAHLERVIMEYEAAHTSFDPFGGGL